MFLQIHDYQILLQMFDYANFYFFDSDKFMKHKQKQKKICVVPVVKVWKGGLGR